MHPVMPNTADYEKFLAHVRVDLDQLQDQRARGRLDEYSLYRLNQLEDPLSHLCSTLTYLVTELSVGGGGPLG